MSKLLLAVVALCVSFSVQARGNADSGQELAKSKACMTCHGADGNKPSAPEQPVLAGQYPDYIVKALKDYKNGKRNNAIMKGFASGLTAQDMEDLAAWFSSQKSALHDQR